MRNSTLGKFYNWNVSPSPDGKPFPSYVVRGQALLNAATESLNMEGIWYTVTPRGGGDYSIGVLSVHEATLRAIVERVTADHVAPASVWMLSILIDTRKNPDIGDPACLADVMSNWLSNNHDFEQLLDWSYPTGTDETCCSTMSVYSLQIPPFIQVTVQMLVAGDATTSAEPVADLGRAMRNSDGITRVDNAFLRDIMHNPYLYNEGDAFRA